MNEITQMLFEIAAGTAIGQVLSVIALVSFLLTHITPHLPVSVTSKVPDWLMVIVNSLAGQYRFAQNASADLKGNPK